MDLSSSSSEDRRFRLGKGEGRLLGVVGSEEGSESSGLPAGAVGLLGGSFPPFPPWRNVTCASNMAPRLRPVCLQSLLVSGALKSSWAVGPAGCLVERFQIPFRILAVVLTDSALASWKFLDTVAFSSSKFWVDWSALAIFSSTLASAAVWSCGIWLLRSLS